MSKSKQRRPFIPPTAPPTATAPVMKPISQPPVVAAPQPAVFGSDVAPVIYFDGVIAFGVCNNVLQLELASNQLVPVSMDGTKVKVKHVVAVHLRCAPEVALNLVEVIEKMLTKPPPMTKQ
jgi:hypothetical protein